MLTNLVVDDLCRVNGGSLGAVLGVEAALAVQAIYRGKFFDAVANGVKWGLATYTAGKLILELNAAGECYCNRYINAIIETNVCNDEVVLVGVAVFSGFITYHANILW